MAETLKTRVERLESLVGVLADKQAKLDDVLVILAEAQIKTEERFRELREETDRRFQETEAQIREMNKKTDERIAQLVVAIGEFLRRQS